MDQSSQTNGQVVGAQKHAFAINVVWPICNVKHLTFVLKIPFLLCRWCLMHYGPDILLFFEIKWYWVKVLLIIIKNYWKYLYALWAQIILLPRWALCSRVRLSGVRAFDMRKVAEDYSLFIYFSLLYNMLIFACRT